MIRKAYTVFRCSADRAIAPSSLCIESENKTSSTSKAYTGAKSHCEPGSFAPSLHRRQLNGFITLLIFMLSLIPGTLLPQAGTYYDAVSVGETSFPYQLKQRVRSPYTKVSYDNFDETNVANFSSYSLGGSLRGVRCVYSYYEHQYTGTFAWGTMSREHTFCHSWMPSHPSESTNEYADQHHLFPTHQNGANGVRSNHPLGWVTTVTSSFLEGKYGKDSSNNNVYEPRNPHKGDAARALLYMCIRYDSASGSARWTFDWLNTTRLPSLSEGPQSVQTLLTWHFQDPPDKWEVDRNNYIQSIQGNRNPFVDRPEYVNYINFNDLSYVSRTYAAEPTNYPTSVAAVPSGSNLTVSWTDAVTGSQAPASYLIVLYNRDNYFLPIDGEVYADDTDLSDGRGVITVLHSGSDQYTFTGLPSSTYYATVYSVNGSGTQTNYKINGTLPRANATVSGSTVTQVSFVTTSATVGEGSGTYQLQVQLVNPSPTVATQVQVALTSGSAADIGNYTTQTVTFPANSSATQQVTITITDDAVGETDESFQFALQNITGGNSAVIASPSTFSLTITDNDGGITPVIVNEWSQGPDGGKEWVELLVVSDGANIQGMKLTDDNGSLEIIFSGTGFQYLAHGTLIVIYNGFDLDPLVASDLNYNGTSDKVLMIPSNNNSGTWALTRTTGWGSTTGAFGNGTATDVPKITTSADAIIFTTPKSAGLAQSSYFADEGLVAATDASNWITVAAGSATPGQPNGGANTSWILGVLPVELTSFTASVSDGRVHLNWSTATERENYGFDVERSDDGIVYNKVGFVQGSGNSNAPRTYSFSELPPAGISNLIYRLKQTDFNGAFTYSPAISVAIANPQGFGLHQNYPNPFNPETQVSFSLPVSAHITLRVYDTLGQMVMELINGTTPAGLHTITIDGSPLPGGAYFCKLETAGYTGTIKMMLLK